MYICKNLSFFSLIGVCVFLMLLFCLMSERFYWGKILSYGTYFYCLLKNIWKIKRCKILKINKLKICPPILAPSHPSKSPIRDSQCYQFLIYPAVLYLELKLIISIIMKCRVKLQFWFTLLGLIIKSLVKLIYSSFDSERAQSIFQISLPKKSHLLGPHDQSLAMGCPWEGAVNLGEIPLFIWGHYCKESAVNAPMSKKNGVLVLKMAWGGRA